MKFLFLTLILATSAFGQSRSGQIGASFANEAFGQRPGSSYDDEPPMEYAGRGNSNQSSYSSNNDRNYDEARRPRRESAQPEREYENDSRSNREARPEPRSRDERPRQRGGNQRSGGGYLEDSLASALSIMDRVELDGNDQRILERMRSKAANLVLQVGDPAVCGNMAAYKVDGKIHICSAFYNNPSIENGQYMILHEIAHLGGLGEECDADRLAGKILAAAGEPVFSFYGCRMN